MKHFTFFKPLLIAVAMLLGGVNFAWADVTPFSESYNAESSTTGWTTNTGSRFTPVILNESTNYFLSVNQDERNNNGATVTGTIIAGKAAAGDDFTLMFDMRLSSSSNQTATSFTIRDASGSGTFFSLAETGAWATTWYLNGTETQITLPNSNKADKSNTIADVTWCSYKITRSGSKTYLTITNKETSETIFERAAISGSSATGGLGNIEFGSSRYFANFAIDNIVVRDVEESDVPATPKAVYTIYYKNGESTVKTVTDTEDVGTVIPVESSFWVSTTKYVKNDGEPSSLTVAAGGSTLEVAVTEPEKHNYEINAVAGGSTIQELAAGSCYIDDSYVAYVPKAIKYNSQYYVLNDGNLSNYAASYVMGNADASKEITYTLDEGIVAFSEVGSGLNGAYSSGGNTNVNTQLANATVNAGLYIAEINVISKGGSGTNHRQEAVYVAGVEVAATEGNINGIRKISFTVSADDSEVYVQGKGASNYSDNLDYVLIRKVLVPEGNYYLKNKSNGAYLGAGLNWGTKAMSSDIGHVVTLECLSSDNYSINTTISNGGDSHYLNGQFCDGAAFGWTFIPDGAGYFTISDGTNKLTAGAIDAELTLTNGTGENTKWKLLTVAEWTEENESRLESATATNGVDATFYIPAANFNRNDNTENAKWLGSPTISGLSENSANTNYNGEKYNTNFDVYQSLTGLKPGAYKLTAQGFYRNGTTDDRNAILYANDCSVALVNIRSAGVTAQDNDKGFTTANGDYYVPNTQVEAAKALNNDYYNNELFVVVGEDGNLRLGVKKTTAAAKDWTVFDNFQLTYYGNTVPLTIGSSGWATLYTPYALDFSSLSSNFTAYTATVESSIVTLTPVNNVPANTGVVLNGTAGDYNIPVITSSVTGKGDLMGNANAATAFNAFSGFDLYMLALNDRRNAQFTLVNAGSIAAGKAFLKVASGRDVKAFSVVLGDETTDVNGVRGKTEEVRGEIFNLVGQRMSKMQKGINIVNGKKVIVK